MSEAGQGESKFHAHGTACHFVFKVTVHVMLSNFEDQLRKNEFE